MEYSSIFVVCVGDLSLIYFHMLLMNFLVSSQFQLSLWWFGAIYLGSIHRHIGSLSDLVSQRVPPRPQVTLHLKKKHPQNMMCFLQRFHILQLVDKTKHVSINTLGFLNKNTFQWIKQMELEPISCERRQRPRECLKFTRLCRKYVLDDTSVANMKILRMLSSLHVSQIQT